jgi:hypothetical protein
LRDGFGLLVLVTAADMTERERQFTYRDRAPRGGLIRTPRLSRGKCHPIKRIAVARPRNPGCVAAFVESRLNCCLADHH